MRWREPSDLDACVSVLRLVHDGDGYPANWPDDPQRWLAQPSLLDAWVVETAQPQPQPRIVGHVSLCRSGSGDLAPGAWNRLTGRPAEQTAVVSRLFVSPAGRGRGIGAVLLAHAARAARSRGQHPVLDVLATDSAAAALYRRSGWNMLAAVDEWWGPSRQVTVHCYAGPAGGPEPASTPIA